MNKKISSPLSIALIVVLAIAFSFFSWTKNQELDLYTVANQINQIKKKEKPSCKTRAFQGLAEIKVWQISQGEKTVLGVAKEDLEKIPVNITKDLELIDPTPELKKELAESSEKNPVEVSISAFATLCNGATLASLNYEDGIFRPYIVD
ncbi:hypothetical protein KKF29_02215 [Patescibacteria group bacterium]|nr:hypothetical protein [Patescibacteria group bacterium]